MKEPAELVFDGDCGICRYWVRYWQRVVGPRARYRPYQEVAADYPEVPELTFRRSIQLFLPDGSHYEGAEATFRLLALAPGHGGWLWCYRHLPGFRPASEFGYRFFSQRRGLLSLCSQLLWGRSPPEPTRYERTCRVFLHLLGWIYLTAFVSLGLQIPGLVGTEGILPAVDYFSLARERLGTAAYLKMPSLFWLNAGNAALQIACLLGVALAGLVIAGVFARPALALLYVLYLSLLYAGQLFMRFQWDLLLLETGFLAIFLSPRLPATIWLYRWLIFRFMFLSGAVKLLSGDPTWDNLTALHYHFETQPLPTPLAWYAHHLPGDLLSAAVGLTLFIELVVVFLIFLPRRARFLAAWAILLFEAAIFLTGNYNFFNLLTMALCVLLFDDAALRTLTLRRVGSATAATPATLPPAGHGSGALQAALVALILTLSASQLWRTFAGSVLPVAGSMERALRPFGIVNPYGLFAVMTTTRPELIVEGSVDRRSWHAYPFRYKPAALDRRPPWNVPHQPRLDWQLWFAALGNAERNPWIGNLAYRLLHNSPTVVRLFAENPFPHEPPRYVRVTAYRYRFTTPQERRATGNWWRREPLGMYLPAVNLRRPAAHVQPAGEMPP